MWLLRDLKLRGLLSIDYEALLENCYTKWVRPGDTVVDVGAHHGRHLSKFVECVGVAGKVMGFEPLPLQFDYLKNNFCISNVWIKNLALCNDIGSSWFTYAEGSPQESGLRNRIFQDPQNARPIQILVETTKLDTFIEDLPSLSFIKIDVEGAEMEVLKGAGGVLERYRPIVSVEYGRGSYSAYGNDEFTLYDYSVALGYRIYDIFLNPLVSRDVWKLAVDSIYYDFFMIPVERENEFLERVRPCDFPLKAAKVLRNGVPIELYEMVRIPNGFDSEKYLNLNPDVRAAGVSAENHYLEYGFFEGRSY
ncbi:FkbM family methyltransferase [Aromatoleum evansii]|nr:FkbM family methyltransferase [Aromatoleum evansii]